VLIGDPNNNVNGSDSGFVQVYDITDVLSVEEFKSDLFKVFPNPTSSNLTIQSKVNIREIRIIDINGRLLNNFDAINEDQEISISVENLSNGVYFLRLQIENSEQIIRFVKS
jgi:hypothetical protein